MKQEISNIKWETTLDGRASRLVNSHRATFSPMFSKTVALAKMTNVEIISAEFEGDLCIFEKWATLLLDAGDVVEYYGMYKLGMPTESSKSPTLCLRTSVWNKTTDLQSLNLSEDRWEYFRSDKQLTSTILFLNDQQCKLLISMISVLATVFQRGVTLQSSTTTELWQSIQCKLREDHIEYGLTFSPFLATNVEIVEWVNSLRNWYHDLDTTLTVLPDEECKISYPCFLFARLLMPVSEQTSLE